MTDHRIRQRDMCARYQRTAAACSAVARYHLLRFLQTGEEPHRAAAVWYQLESAAEYRGARGLLDAVTNR